ncbi:MAG: EAL domain-containing protein, partial [Desulfuromonadaceae bacterium]|nr:EAL domain-containing protein [Desulfuromonadaceae bacterium]
MSPITRGHGTAIRHSLKLRLTVIIGALALFTTLMLSNLVGRYARQQIESDKGSLLREVAVQMANRLNQDMNSRAQEIQFLAALQQMRNSSTPPIEKQRLFEQVQRSYPHYAWIGMTDTAGKVDASTDGLLVGKDVSKREWFIEGKKRLHFVNAHDAFLLAKMVPKPRWDDLPLRLIDVSTPVYDNSGEFLGVICGHLSFDWAFEVRERLLANMTDNNIEMLVLNREGHVLMGTPSLPSLSKGLERLQSITQARSKQVVPVTERWPDGITYLTVAVAEPGFRDYPGMGWSVVTREKVESAFVPARRLQQTVITLGIFSATLFAWLLWRTLNRQLKPLEKVSQAAEQIRSHNLSTVIPDIPGQGEIAVFAQSLTSLVGELQEQNEELRLTGRIFEESRQGILITDAQGIILRVNAAFCEITRYRPEEVIGQRPAILSSKRHDNQFYSSMWHSLTTSGVWKGEIWNRNKDGEIYPEWLSINALFDSFGEPTHYIGLFDDITEKKEYEQKLLHLANYDSLTELPNRHLLLQKIHAAISQADASESHLAVLFTDLDEFKNINDALGHPAGDLVLAEVARRFQACTGADELVARWGGDEFVIVVPGGDGAAAVKTATMLFDSLTQPFIIEQKSYHLSASIGIVLFPQDNRTVDGLLRCSDAAMYHAKQKGKNRYSFYDISMNDKIEQFLEIDAGLRNAIKRNELRLLFQPQFDCTGTTIIALEALLRWRNPVLGDVSPAIFIPVAEETGHISVLGQWVIEQAFMAGRAIVEYGLPPLPVSINISAMQLRESGLAKLIIDLARRHGVAPALCRLEITESILMSVDAVSSEVLRQLRTAGFSLSIDDFGTGYSSLQGISMLQPDEIKIDQSFIRDLATDQTSRNIVSFTISLAKAMGIVVVAEGVETREQMELLRQLGDVRLQGFL